MSQAYEVPGEDRCLLYSVTEGCQECRQDTQDVIGQTQKVPGSPGRRWHVGGKKGKVSAEAPDCLTLGFYTGRASDSSIPQDGWAAWALRSHKRKRNAEDVTRVRPLAASWISSSHICPYPGIYTSTHPPSLPWFLKVD